MKFRNGRINKYKIIRKVILSTMELEEYVEFGPTGKEIILGSVGDLSRGVGVQHARCM